MTDLLYAMNALLQSILFVFLFTELGESRFGFNKLLLIWFFSFEAVYFLFTYPLSGVPSWIPLMIRNIITPLTIYLCFRGGFWRNMLRCYLPSFIVGLISEISGFLIVWYVFGMDVELKPYEGVEPPGVSSGRIVTTQIMLILAVLIVLIIKNRRGEDRHILIHLRVILGFALGQLGYFVLYFLANVDTMDFIEAFVQYNFQALLFSMLMLHYLSSKRIITMTKSEEELADMEAQRESERKYFELADSRYEDISRLRDDLNARLSEVRSLMGDSSGRQRAEDMLEEMDRRLGSIRAVNFCDDHTLNAVLTIKLNDSRVTENGIRVETVLKDCLLAGVDNYEMCSLVSNMFDNALESCLKAPDPSKTFIEIKSGLMAEYFLIRVTNSCTGTLSTLSRKGKGHGYGIRIIQEICRRHGGEYTVRQSGDTVISSAFLRVSQ